MKGITLCAALATVSFGLAGCASLASSTNSLTDERIRSESAAPWATVPAN